ncbi:MAG: extracellular solute-binding protein [Anaerolineae bacterium]|nr:extracellular solute-binding protein [Anaerolineae bacterium]
MFKSRLRAGWMAGCVCLALLLSVLFGCGTPAPPTATPEPVKIYFAFAADRANHYADLIERFNEQHPGITVERKTAQSENTWEYLLKEKQIDVLEFPSVALLFETLYEQEQVLDLLPFIQAAESIDLDDYYPGLLEPYRRDGGLWALPAEIDLAVMYYNKDLFDQFGVRYPGFEWTWEEFLDTAQQIRAPNENIYGFVTYPSLTIPFVYQHGGKLLDDWYAPTRATLDDPLTVETVEWLASLVHDYDTTPSFEMAAQQFANDGNAGYVFWRKKVGIYLGLLSERDGASWGPGARWEMEWGIVPLPRDVQASTVGFGYSYMILKDTAYPDECWKWLTFLSEQLPVYAMPARKSIANSALWEETVGAVTADVARESIEYALLYSSAQSGYDQAINGYSEAVLAAMNGQSTAQEALTQAQLALQTEN